MNPETLFGGRIVPVKLNDGAALDVTVKQLRLGQYEAAFKLIDDEIALTALICGQDKAWADNLQPESYEALFTAAQEVNAKGFFAWSTRRADREEKIQQAQILAFSQLPPDVARAAAEAGLKAQNNPSRIGSRIGPPPAA
jgi:cell division inhibitor SulA